MMGSQPPDTDEPRSRGISAWLRERLETMTPLEQALWAIVGVLAIVAAAVFFSSVTPGSSSNRGSLTPTFVAQNVVATRTLPPVPTRTPSPTTTPSPMPLPTLEPLAIPTPPADGVLLTFSPNPERTGWIGSKDLGPHWRDRNLHSGMYQGQALVSVLQFDLRSLAPGSKILFAALEITGRNARYLGTSGSWKLDLVDVNAAMEWDDANYDTVRQSTGLATLAGALNTKSIAVGQTNRFVFTSDQLKLLQKQVDIGPINLRLSGPSDGADNLFTWDAGPGPGEPTLYVVAVPASFVVITPFPTPASVFAAATLSAHQTLQARSYGTPTSLPRGFVTATSAPTGYLVVTNVPPPQNRATATALSDYATAVAFTTGTFTPMPANVITVTPTPPFFASNQFTPVPTSVPTVNTEVSIIEYKGTPIPPELGLIGKILFYTNREGTKESQVWVMDPNGNLLGKLTGDDYYRIASKHDLFSQDKLFHADVGKDEQGLWMIPIFDISKGIFIPLIKEEPKAVGIGSYHPAWAPQGGKIAYVSGRSGFEDIYVYDLETKRSVQLTYSVRDPKTFWKPYNKHPSWSPDGKQIIFFSDRDTLSAQRQIWIMNADGTAQRSLRPSAFDDYDPVWVKW